VDVAGIVFNFVVLSTSFALIDQYSKASCYTQCLKKRPTFGLL